jgi:pyridoxal 5'-phosphate synthase pdxT subunit
LVSATANGPPPPPIGVLALQGGYAAHVTLLRGLGVDAHEVRTAEQLEGLDGLVMPGGESTTMTLAIERDRLAEPLRAFAASGRPILGTCAGLIMLDRAHLGLLDVVCERNAFGRQTHSFETDLEIGGRGVHAVFIRAPWVTEAGPGVEILAEVEGHPVAVREGRLLGVSFHPELAGETAIHESFLADVRAVRATA